MIKASLMLSDETPICEAYFIHPPRVGEYVWPQGGDREQIVAEFGTGSFQVTEVAHWCLANHVPRADAVIHSILLYVEPVLSGRQVEDE